MRPAGKWHSRGETSVTSRTGRTGLLTRDVRGDEVAPRMRCPRLSPLGAASPLGASASRRRSDTRARMYDLCAGRACQLTASGCPRSGPGLRGLHGDGGQHERVPACPGGRASAATAGPDTRSGRIPARRTVTPARGLCAPRTAHDRVRRERGHKDHRGRLARRQLPLRACRSRTEVPGWSPAASPPRTRVRPRVSQAAPTAWPSGKSGGRRQDRPTPAGPRTAREHTARPRHHW